MGWMRIRNGNTGAIEWQSDDAPTEFNSYTVTRYARLDGTNETEHVQDIFNGASENEFVHFLETLKEKSKTMIPVIEEMLAKRRQK